MQNGSSTHAPADHALPRVEGYRELGELLQREIESGVHGAGEQLPTEAALSRRYSLNRHTVRAALRELEQEGYIYRVRGRGTFVARRKMPYPVNARTSFTGSLRNLGLDGGMRVLDSGETGAPAEVAEALGIALGEPVVRLEILRHVEDVPRCVTTSFLPVRRVKGLLALANEMTSLYGTLREHFGIRGIRRAWSLIEAAMPGQREVALLSMPRNMPLLVKRSLAKCGRGEPLEYCISRNRADAYTLRVDLEEAER